MVNSFIKKYLIFFYLIKIGFGLKGFTVDRACINNNDSTISLTLHQLSLGCVIFSKVYVFSKLPSGEFNKIDSIPTLENNSLFDVPDLNPSREYFLLVILNCGSLDSVFSDTFSIDKFIPDNMELDSVSIDLNTQQLIAGWQANTSADTKGYRLYKRGSGSYDSIGNTTGLDYIFNSTVSYSYPYVTIAAYDSCNLFGLISAEHRPIELNYNFDTCSRSIALNWSGYVGWATEKHYIYMSLNANQYILLDSVLGNTLTYTYANVELGNEYCFYIRARRRLSSVSSSSRVVCISTRARNSTVDIERVSVVDNSDIEIVFTSSNASDISYYEIHKGLSKSNLSIYDKTLVQNYIDNNVDVDGLIYYYQVLAYDNCDSLIGSSAVSNSILLTKANSLLTWNSYFYWPNGVQDYLIEEESSSTWNILGNTLDTNYPYQLENTFSQTCIRIKAEGELSQNFSYSNSICLNDTFLYYYPNAISPNNGNNIFSITGVNIDFTKSKYQIYNRWGEKILEKSANHSTDIIGLNLQTGIYPLIITLYSKDQDKIHIADQLNVFR